MTQLEDTNVLFLVLFILLVVCFLVILLFVLLVILLFFLGTVFLLEFEVDALCARWLAVVLGPCSSRCRLLLILCLDVVDDYVVLVVFRDCFSGTEYQLN